MGHLPPSSTSFPSPSGKSKIIPTCSHKPLRRVSHAETYKTAVPHIGTKVGLESLFPLLLPLLAHFSPSWPVQRGIGVFRYVEHDGATRLTARCSVLELWHMHPFFSSSPFPKFSPLHLGSLS